MARRRVGQRRFARRHGAHLPGNPCNLRLVPSRRYPPRMPRITAADAEELLDGLPLIPAMAGSIPEMKALRDRCLAEGIPVLVGCPPGAGKG